MRRRLTRAVLVLIVGLVCLEVAGRLARWVLRPSIASPDGRVTILTIGDSFTFGMGVLDDGTQPLSYPALLGDLLEHEEPGRYRVVNVGRPGWNSGQWVEELPRHLEELRPAAVLALCGTNNDRNYQSSRYLQMLAKTPTASTLEVWAHRLVVVRLIANLLEWAGGDFYGVESAPTADARQPRPDEGSLMRDEEKDAHQRLVIYDLEALGQLARGSGAEFVIGTYPENVRVWRLNASIREAIGRLGVRSFDMEPIFAAVKKQEGRSAVISSQDGFHANSRGYALMALEAYAALSQLDTAWAPQGTPEGHRAWLDTHRRTKLRTVLESLGAAAPLSPECARDEPCVASWLADARDWWAAIATLQELAPAAIWRETALKNYRRLAQRHDTALPLLWILMPDNPDEALEVTAINLRSQPGSAEWRYRRRKLLEKLGRSDALELPGAYRGDDFRMHRVPSAAPSQSAGAVQYLVGGEMFRAALRVGEPMAFDVQLTVSGSPCGPEDDAWPEVVVTVDGAPLLEGLVSAQTPVLLSGKASLTAGAHELVATFRNDRFKEGECDRNIDVHRLAFVESK